MERQAIDPDANMPGGPLWSDDENRAELGMCSTQMMLGSSRGVRAPAGVIAGR
jgi:hypothetical protein